MSYRIGHFCRFLTSRLVENGMHPCQMEIPKLTIGQAVKLMELASIVTSDADHAKQKIQGSVEQLARVEREFCKALRNMQSAYRNRHFYLQRIKQVGQVRSSYRQCIKQTEVLTDQMEAEADAISRRFLAQLGEDCVFRIVPDLKYWIEDS